MDLLLQVNEYDNFGEIGFACVSEKFHFYNQSMKADAFWTRKCFRCNLHFFIYLCAKLFANVAI